MTRPATALVASGAQHAPDFLGDNFRVNLIGNWLTGGVFRTPPFSMSIWQGWSDPIWQQPVPHQPVPHQPVWHQAVWAVIAISDNPDIDSGPIRTKRAPALPQTRICKPFELRLSILVVGGLSDATKHKATT